MENRKPFRFHLLTLVILTVEAGLALGLNLCNMSDTRFPDADHRYIDVRRVGPGWPFPVVSMSTTIPAGSTSVISEPLGWHEAGLIGLNITIIALILVQTAIISEAVIRRRNGSTRAFPVHRSTILVAVIAFTVLAVNGHEEETNFCDSDAVMEIDGHRYGWPLPYRGVQTMAGRAVVVGLHQENLSPPLGPDTFRNKAAFQSLYLAFSASAFATDIVLWILFTALIYSFWEFGVLYCWRARIGATV